MENKNSKKKEIHAGISGEIKIRAKYTRQATKARRVFLFAFKNLRRHNDNRTYAERFIA